MDKCVKISFSGDILSFPSNDRNCQTGHQSYNYDCYFDGVKTYLDESDYVVGSFETNCAGEKAGYSRNEMNFNSPDEILPALKNAGFDMLTTANNHCLDRGSKGLLRTIKALDDAGIEHTGTFDSPTEKRYLIKDFDGLKIAFVAYTYGTNSSSNGNVLSDDELYMVNLTRRQDVPRQQSLPKRIAYRVIRIFKPNFRKRKTLIEDPRIFPDCVSDSQIDAPNNRPFITQMADTIEKAKADSDFVVFCLHSGGQFNSECVGYTQWLIDLIASKDVDAIVVNHTHCVLNAAVKDGKCFVAYSLGNFSFSPKEGYYIDGVYADYSILLNLHVNKEHGKLEQVTFSIFKSIKDADGKARVVPTCELYGSQSDGSEKEMLKKDVEAVWKRFAGKEIGFDVVCEEYELISEK